MYLPLRGAVFYQVTQHCRHKPGKSLWQLSQTIQGVEVGALSIPGQRFTVQLDTIDRLQTGNIKIAERENDGGAEMIQK